jgi:hypothetical protein
MNEYNQFNATIKTVNDAAGIGYLVDINIDYRDRNMVNIINRSNASFIQKYNNKILLYILIAWEGMIDLRMTMLWRQLFWLPANIGLQYQKNVSQILNE